VDARDTLAHRLATEVFADAVGDCETALERDDPSSLVAHDDRALVRSRRLYESLSDRQRYLLSSLLELASANAIAEALSFFDPSELSDDTPTFAIAAGEEGGGERLAGELAARFRGFLRGEAEYVPEVSPEQAAVRREADEVVSALVAGLRDELVVDAMKSLEGEIRALLDGPGEHAIDSTDQVERYTAFYESLDERQLTVHLEAVRQELVNTVSAMLSILEGSGSWRDADAVSFCLKLGEQAVDLDDFDVCDRFWMLEQGANDEQPESS